jgi:hypothetical protein
LALSVEMITHLPMMGSFLNSGIYLLLSKQSTNQTPAAFINRLI